MKKHIVALLSVICIISFYATCFGQTNNASIHIRDASFKDSKMIYDVNGKYLRTDTRLIIDSVYSNSSYLFPPKGTSINPDKDNYLNFTINRSLLNGFSIELDCKFNGIQYNSKSKEDSVVFVLSDNSTVELKTPKNIEKKKSSIYRNNPNVNFVSDLILSITNDIAMKLANVDIAKIKIFSSKFSNVSWYNSSEPNHPITDGVSGEILVDSTHNSELRKYCTELFNATNHFKITKPVSVNEKDISGKISIGDLKFGGIVFRIDKSGKHGLVVSETMYKDSVFFDDAKKIADTITINGFKGWRVPNAEDWLNAQLNDMPLPTIKELIRAGIIELDKNYYWVYPSKNDMGEMAFSNGTEADIVLWSTKNSLNKSKLPVIFIRSF